MHDKIFRPWFDIANGPFKPFADRRWGVLAYAGGRNPPFRIRRNSIR